MSIEVHENVFFPKYFNGSRIFTDNFPSFTGKTVLEIGAGTGITFLYLAKNGAKYVLSTDINKFSIQNINTNIKINNLANIQTRESDVFEKIKNSEKFDYIYWNMPFMPIENNYNYQNILEKGLFDPGYNLTKRFLSEAKLYLNKNGKVLVGTGGKNFGNTEKLIKIAKDNNFKTKLLIKEKSTEINPVNFLFYELSQ